MFSIVAFSQQNVLRRNSCSRYWDSGTSSTRRRGQVKHRTLKRYRTLKQQRVKTPKVHDTNYTNACMFYANIVKYFVISLSGSSRNLYHTWTQQCTKLMTNAWWDIYRGYLLWNFLLLTNVALKQYVKISRRLGDVITQPNVSPNKQ